MLIKTRGIVLRALKYSETSLIIDIYTELKGLRSYIVSGVRSRKARIPASILQPMTLLHLVAYHRDEKKLCRTKELTPALVYQSLPFDLKKGAVGTFVTEVLQKTLKEPEAHPELFSFLFGLFEYLDRTVESVKNLHLWFLVQYAAFLGFLPGGTYSEITPIFDLQEGVFAQAALSPHYLKPPYSGFVNELLNCPLEKSHALPFSRTERKHLLEELIKYYRLHIENLPELHAHTVLEMVFG